MLCYGKSLPPPELPSFISDPKISEKRVIFLLTVGL